MAIQQNPIDADSFFSKSLYHVWSVIRDELAALQDKLKTTNPGHVANPISGSIYVRDTAFAAQVFATEYVRTGEIQWQERAKAAISAMDRTDIYNGVEEPIWNRYGWHNNKGSMAATGMLFDALWEAKSLLGIVDSDSHSNVEQLVAYVKKCHLGNGEFAHDAIEGNLNNYSPVQNTTAMALYLLSRSASSSASVKSGIEELIDATFQALTDGQRKDGFWPYMAPGKKQQFWFNSKWAKRSSRIIPGVRNYFIKKDDYSIYFGDAVHHVLVLYYMAKSSLALNDNRHFQSLKSGWEWTRKHFIETPDGSIKFNFDWEPWLSVPRYCNFRETSTYFVIFSILPILQKLGVIENYKPIALGLLHHIEKNLLEKEGTFPSIKAYEGPDEVLRNILPRVGESVAWKGGKLSYLILD